MRKLSKIGFLNHFLALNLANPIQNGLFSWNLIWLNTSLSRLVILLNFWDKSCQSLSERCLLYYMMIHMIFSSWLFSQNLTLYWLKELDSFVYGNWVEKKMMDPKICVSAINVPRLIKTNGLVKYTFKVIVHEIQKMKDFSTNERSIFLI